MTRFEKVITEKKEELKKLLIASHCPGKFGVEDRSFIRHCIETGDCEACWNEEA